MFKVKVQVFHRILEFLSVSKFYRLISISGLQCHIFEPSYLEPDRGRAAPSTPPTAGTPKAPSSVPRRPSRATDEGSEIFTHGHIFRDPGRRWVHSIFREFTEIIHMYCRHFPVLPFRLISTLTALGLSLVKLSVASSKWEQGPNLTSDIACLTDLAGHCPINSSFLIVE